jgi:hypothetical protein
LTEILTLEIADKIVKKKMTWIRLHLRKTVFSSEESKNTENMRRFHGGTLHVLYVLNLWEDLMRFRGLKI